MSDLIKLVGGIEKAREIVQGAQKSIYYCLTFRDYLIIDEYDDRCCICLNDIRTAIADHDRTDNCVNIENHLSPSTKIINK